MNDSETKLKQFIEFNYNLKVLSCSAQAKQGH